MTDRRAVEVLFQGVSLVGASSAIANQLVTGGGWSISNISNYDKSLAGNDSSASSIAGSLASLLVELIHKGIIKGTIS